MEFNEYGLELIKSFERLRLTSYDDGFGYLTVGYGHLSDKFFEVKINQQITEQKANEILWHDIYQDAIPIVNNQLLYENLLNDNQYSALVSIVFNSGSFKYRDNHGEIVQTQLLTALNKKEFDRASMIIKFYKITSNGKQSLGLRRRRLCEHWLYTSYKTTEMPPKDWVKWARIESEKLVV